MSAFAVFTNCSALMGNVVLAMFMAARVVTLGGSSRQVFPRPDEGS